MSRGVSSFASAFFWPIIQVRYAGTPRRPWARFKRASTHPRRSPARLSSSTEFDGDEVVISSGGVVDIDALQMAWSQRVLSILLDTGDSHVLQGAWFQHVLNLARCECSKIGWDEMRKRQTHVHTH